MPLVVDRIIGVWIHHAQCPDHILLSSHLHVSCILWEPSDLLLVALGWNTLTSKKGSYPAIQKPLACISSLAPSFAFVEARWKVSLERGWRWGLIATLWHISVSRVAVISLNSFWNVVGHGMIGWKCFFTTVAEPWCVW